MDMSTIDSARLQHITQMHERPWLAASWQRCLAYGHSPHHTVSFDSVPSEALRRTEEAHHALLQAAKPTMHHLGQAIASTRYFAILTDAAGIVIRTDGAIDRDDSRANVIARIGVNLSERSVGTSAIGTALHEQKPVWLHRGEHFFNDTSVYSCAGAPLFSPQGLCIGMLDLTGIDAEERPELTHMVAQSARSIENIMVQSLPYALMLRVNWLGMTLGDASDGLLVINADGHIHGFNQAAKNMISAHQSSHVNDIFAMSVELFFDAARKSKPCLDVPLWSGLRVNVEPLLPHQQTSHYAAQPIGNVLAQASALTMMEQLPLKEVNTKLIKQAIQDTKGNVAEAAHKLGISRATLYRKLAPTNKFKKSPHE